MTVVRSGGQQRVAMFVINDMRFDSRVRREAQTLAATGYAVVVYAVLTPGAGLPEREEVNGYVIRRLPMPMRSEYQGPGRLGASGRDLRSAIRRGAAGVYLATRPLMGGALHYAFNWRYRWGAWSRRVRRVVAPADVWHAHDLNTLSLALQCADRHGGQVVYDSHEIFVEAGATASLPRTASALLRFLERRWASRAAAVVTVNQSVAGVLSGSLGSRDVTVVHNCATPPVRSRRSPLREAIGLADGQPIVMFHGSLSPGRGLHALVAAFDDARLDDAHLVFMGYGPLRPEIQALSAAARAADRIHFIAPVPPAEVTTWVAGSDVVAMPLEPRTLNLLLATPNKLFEAIAAGVPVVGPTFVQFEHIVYGGPHGRLGVLFEDHDPTSIAHALHEVLSMPPHERQALRAHCRRAAAARWNWAAESRSLTRMYATMTARALTDSEALPAPLHPTGPSPSRARLPLDDPSDA